MNNIQIIQNTSNVATAEGIAALRANPSVPRYREIPEARRVQWLGQTMAQMYEIRHQEYDMKQILMDAATLDEKIMDDSILSDLTQPEIIKAFKKGVFGDFGDFFGVTAISCYGFLRKFLQTPEKQAAIKMARGEYGAQRDRVEETARRLREMMRVAQQEREKQEENKHKDSLGQILKSML